MVLIHFDLAYMPRQNNGFVHIFHVNKVVDWSIKVVDWSIKVVDWFSKGSPNGFNAPHA